MERRYQLVRRLAAGGMGEVFVARLAGAGDFEKTVAVKLLQPHLVDSPELVARFYAEARLSARMQHPNIVEVFDVGQADGRPFLAMQFVEGVSLSTAMRRLHHLGERMPLPLVRLIAIGVCEALSYAHALADGRGVNLEVVHRDVTPSNIMLSTAGAVLLTDFGIARVRGGALTEPGVVRGKVAYLAPEQVLHNAPVDARADQYSAALTLFELLSGENPLRADSSAETLALVIRGAVPPITSRRRDVTKGLAAALERALSAAPGERFASMRDFRTAFVDGPVATGLDLAAWVQQHFSEELATLRTAEPTQTGSLVVTATAPQALPAEEPPLRAPSSQPKLGRWVLVLVLTAVVGAGAGAANYWLKNRQPQVAILVAATDEPTATERPAQVSTVAPIAALAAERLRPVPDAGPPQPSAALTPTLGGDSAGPTPMVPLAAKSKRGVLAGPVSPLDAGPRAAPASSQNARVSPQPNPQRTGYLTADAVPWAQVEEGDTVLDRTPFSRLPLPAGRHALLFRGPNGTIEERTVLILEDEVTLVRVEFP